MTDDRIVGHFNELDDFIDELERDREQVERGIVRVAVIVTADYSLALRRLRVEAGAIVAGRLVRLQRPCGDLIHAPANDTEVTGRAQKLVEEISRRVEALGLERRYGRWLPEASQ